MRKQAGKLFCALYLSCRCGTIHRRKSRLSLDSLIFFSELKEKVERFLLRCRVLTDKCHPSFAAVWKLPTEPLRHKLVKIIGHQVAGLNAAVVLHQAATNLNSRKERNQTGEGMVTTTPIQARALMYRVK